MSSLMVMRHDRDPAPHPSCTRADLEARHELLIDADPFRFVAAPSRFREETWNRLLRYIGHRVLLQHGSFTIIGKQDGRFLGEVGLFESQRDPGPDVDGHTEVGWILDRPAQDQGLAAEAALAALGWMDRTRAPAQTVCIIGSGNKPSPRSADKLGYQSFGSCMYKDIEHVMLKRSLPDTTGPSPARRGTCPRRWRLPAMTGWRPGGRHAA